MQDACAAENFQFAYVKKFDACVARRGLTNIISIFNPSKSEMQNLTSKIKRLLRKIRKVRFYSGEAVYNVYNTFFVTITFHITGTAL